MKPYRIAEKSGTPVYLINVPHRVLEAFIQILALPELFEEYTARLPECCKYGLDLPTWSRYLTLYFSGAQLLKRPLPCEGEGEGVEWKRDTSRPPKRYRRDFIEWEFCLALVHWIFENHRHIKAFLRSEHETLDVVMPLDQTLTVGDQEVQIAVPLDARKDGSKRLKDSIQRIVDNHYDYAIEVTEIAVGVHASNVFSYPRSIQKAWTWPLERDDIQKLTLEAKLIVMTFKWLDWDGKSL